MYRKIKHYGKTIRDQFHMWYYTKIDDKMLSWESTLNHAAYMLF